jgi:hypothetical protein
VLLQLSLGLRRARGPADALPRWPWRMLCRRCLGSVVRVMTLARGCFAALALADALPLLSLGLRVRVMPPARGCFATLALADALPPLLLGLRRARDALCPRMLCRVGPGRCFATVSSFLGGCFATTTSPLLLTVYCVVSFLQVSVG